MSTGGESAQSLAPEAGPPSAGPPSTGHPSHLPFALTSFIGRTEELAETAAHLHNTRLLTLTGAGGSGKTRLSQELAGRLAPMFPDGVYWCELSPVTDPALVATAFAAALGIREKAGVPLAETIAAHIGVRHLLVVVDNCEHLIGDIATLVEPLLQHCPHLSVLATSREPLRVLGETTWFVPPFPSPTAETTATSALAASSEAVQLFVERARLVQPGFSLADDNAAVIGEICRTLDGLPLAIELAAARVRVLSPADIAAGLQDRFRLLRGGARLAPARQQTLQASVDWSHDLLSAPEQALLRRLAVFAGAPDLAAVDSVCTGGDVTGNVLDVLTALVDRSLVNADHRSGTVRYRMLETVRQYAAAMLQSSGERGEYAQRHLRHVHRVIERAEAARVAGHPDTWLALLDASVQDTRSALEWANEQGDRDRLLSMVPLLCRYWAMRGHFSEGGRWCRRLLPAPDAPASSANAKLLSASARLRLHAGGVRPAAETIVRAIEVARQCGDDWELGRAQGILGVILTFTNPAAARAAFEECASLAKAVGDDSGLVEVEGVVAISHVLLDDHATARSLLDAAEPRVRRSGDPWLLAWLLVSRAWGHVRRGEWAAAEATLDEAWSAATVMDEPLSRMFTVHLRAEMLRMRGRPDAARAAIRAELAATTGTAHDIGVVNLGPTLAHLEIDAGDFTAARRWAEDSARRGREMAYTHLSVRALLPLVEAQIRDGELTLAQARLGELDAAVAAFDGIGHRADLASMHSMLAAATGDLDEAEAAALGALALAQQGSLRPALIGYLGDFAGLLTTRKRWEEAARLYGAVDTLREDYDVPGRRVTQAAERAQRQACAEELGPTEYSRATASGARSSLDETVSRLSQPRPPAQAPAQGPAQWPAQWPAQSPSRQD